MGLGKLAQSAAAYKAVAEDFEAPEPQPQASGSRRPLLPQPSAGSNSSYNHGYGYGATDGLRRQDSAEGVTGVNGVNGVVLDDEAVESLLEEAGLYVGNYRTYVLLYALVPFCCTIFLAILAPLPALLHTPAPPSPSPFPELLLGASLWSLAYVLATPLYTLFSYLPLPPSLSTSLAASTHAVLRNALRIAALPILELSQPAGGEITYRAAVFAHVWAFALGCGAADACVGVWMGYKQLGLYKGVMVRPEEARRVVGAWLRGRTRAKAPSSAQHSQTHAANNSFSPDRNSDRNPRPIRLNSSGTGTLARVELEQDLDALVNLKAREDLEELYGVHAIRIPVFVTCLLRLASLALLVGFILIMSAAWLASPYALPPSPSSFHTAMLPPTQSVAPFWLTFAGVCVAHAALATLHAPPLLSKVGAHVAAYAGLVLGLGALFAGLGMWDVLA